MKRHDLAVLCLAGAVLGIALFGLLGYAIGATWMYQWAREGIGMAVQTALAFAMLAVAVILLERR